MEKININPIVTIIIPIYNAELYLERCLKSVKNQSYKNFECLCVNDGSTDNSQIIIDKYCLIDDRFRSIIKENGGTASARNMGIHQARGKYIYYIDSDDYINENLLHVCVSECEKNKLDILYFAADVKGDSSYSKEKIASIKKYCSRKIEYRVCSGIEMYGLMLKKGHICVHVHQQFINRNFLLNKGMLFPNIYNEDNPYTVINLLKANRVLSIDHELITLYRHEFSKEDNAVKNVKFENVYGSLKPLLMIKNYLLLNNIIPQCLLRYIEEDFHKRIKIIVDKWNNCDECEKNKINQLPVMEQIEFKIIINGFLKKGIDKNDNSKLIENKRLHNEKEKILKERNILKNTIKILMN